MKKISFIVLSIVLFLFASCGQKQGDTGNTGNTSKVKFEVKKEKDKSGYTYETVSNDPMGTRIYTLKNGLKVYLSVNKEAPRIQTYIGVKAGATYDPKETTGLAHYLEHMMFKGTDKFGTKDWAKEKVLIKKISDLFEKHKNTKDAKKKKEIYAEIDKVSQEAAKYAIANEYDKIVSWLGAKGTNAYTSNEKTVYINDIPKNSLEKWLKLEQDRFSNLVLRIFHTELETVYEEFNMGQDNDNRKVWKETLAGLFPTHPYGTQTVIGKGEHLKSPSMINIMNYYHKYYVPNNMAVCLAGDLDFDQTIKLIDNTFGKLKKGNVPEFKSPKEAPMTKSVKKEVLGPNAESVVLAYRTKGVNTKDEKYVTLINQILYNGTAGLIDLDLNQKQKVQGAYGYSNFMKYYGVHEFGGTPRAGQKLEEVKDLLLAQIEKIKKGQFEDWMIEAAINNLKLSRIRQQENNSRAHLFISTFTEDIKWEDYLKFNSELEKITKKDLVKFANETYKNNYVVVYKRKGQDKNTFKVEKPQITAVPINRDVESKFFQDLKKGNLAKLQPVFVDFDKKVKKEELKKGMDFFYLENPNNELFELYYIVDMGKNHNKKLPIAVDYLPYLGTDKYTPEQLKKELFKLGLHLGVNTKNNRSYIYILGLKKSYEKGVELLEHLLANAKADKAIYADYIKGIFKERADNKSNKSRILWGAMRSFGKYGEKSPYRDIFSADELKKINPKELTDLVKGITSYKHKVVYYGKDSKENAKKVITKLHKTPAQLKDYPKETKYVNKEMKENKVYFVNYDMVQAQLILLTNAGNFDVKDYSPIKMFNEYYGGGMGSIVFQEIRESKGLAYTAFASYSMAIKKEDPNYIFSFVGTQSDKVKEATSEMLKLMNNMAKSETQYNMAKEALKKKIESERITKMNVFWTYLNNLDRGIKHDIRKDIYNNIQNMPIDKLEKFFNKKVKGKNFTFLVLGNKKHLKMDVLKKLGKVQELSLKDIFNY